MEKIYRCGCDLEKVFNKLFISSFKEITRVDIIVGGKCKNNECNKIIGEKLLN